MVRHIVVFTWNEVATEERIAELERELSALPAQIPSLVEYKFGRNLGLTDGAADFAIVADADSEQGWKDYLQHPAHVAAVDTYLKPLIATRTAIQVAL